MKIIDFKNRKYIGILASVLLLSLWVTSTSAAETTIGVVLQSKGKWIATLRGGEKVNLVDKGPIPNNCSLVAQPPSKDSKITIVLVDGKKVTYVGDALPKEPISVSDTPSLSDRLRSIFSQMLESKTRYVSAITRGGTELSDSVIELKESGCDLAPVFAQISKPDEYIFDIETVDGDKSVMKGMQFAYDSGSAGPISVPGLPQGLLRLVSVNAQGNRMQENAFILVSPADTYEKRAQEYKKALDLTKQWGDDMDREDLKLFLRGYLEIASWSALIGEAHNEVFVNSSRWKKLFDDVLGTPPEGHKPVWKGLLEAIPWIAIASIMTLYIHHWGWLRGMENTTLDSLLRFWSLKAKNVVVVEISNNDYKDLFGAKSPLSPPKVQSLIESIVSGEPAVVVVDLDTSPDIYSDLTIAKEIQSATKIIWAVDALPKEEPHEEAADTEKSGANEHVEHAGHDEEPIFEPEHVLGKSLEEAHLATGISVFPQDSDGIIRRYKRRFQIDSTHNFEMSKQNSPLDHPDGKTKIFMSSLSWAAAKAFAAKSLCPEVQKHDEAIFSFSGGEKYIPTISAGDLELMKGGAGWKQIAQNKIVLLGGAYRAARDQYITRVGPAAGVKLVAQAIEADLQCAAIHPVDHGVMTFVEVAVGFILAYLNCRFPVQLGTGLGLILVSVFTGGLSFLTFRTLSWWADFIPVLFAVQIHSLVDHIKEGAEMKKELEHCKREHHS